MTFRTEYVGRRADFTLSPERPVATLGSCFADNISARMRNALWAGVNPAGTLYNPFSISRVLKLCLEADCGVQGIQANGCLTSKSEETIRKSLFHHNGATHSWLFDSKMSGSNEEDVIIKIRGAYDILRDTLSQGEALLITFGTAMVYSLAEDESYIVSNCHKMPASLFTRRRLSVDEIVGEWTELSQQIGKRYPRLRIIFTVSPVRHLKDGMEENAISKAILRLAIDEICRRNDNCSYFPAYEIVTDDLRDYRFYASDMAHPSTEAVEYIWNKFKSVYLDAEGIALLKEGERLVKGFAHRPLVETPATMATDATRLDRLRSEASVFSRLHPLMLSPF